MDFKCSAALIDRSSLCRELSWWGVDD